MAYFDDLDFVNDVANAVARSLKQAGYNPAMGPGLPWLKEQIMLAETSEVPREIIERVCMEAVAWAEEEGLEPVSLEEEDSIPRQFVASSVGYGIYTAQQVLPKVKALRQALWDTQEAPFASTSEGYEEALAWLLKAAREEQSKPIGRVEIMMRVEVASPDFKDFERLPVSKSDASLEHLHNLLNGLENYEILYLTWRPGHENEPNATSPRRSFYPILQKSDGEGVGRSLKVSFGGSLARLAEGIQEIAKATQWWSDRETLDFVMCGGNPPIPGIRSSVQSTGYQSVTLTMHGPATVREVAQAYEQVLKKFKRNPKPLSQTHGEILRLVYETPRQAWRQRHALWLEWCTQNPKLKRYKHKETLSTEYQRALERITWGVEEKTSQNAKSPASNPLPTPTLSKNMPRETG